MTQEKVTPLKTVAGEIDQATIDEHDRVMSEEGRRLKRVDRYLDLEYHGLQATLEQIRIRMHHCGHLMLEIGLLLTQVREHEGEERMIQALDQAGIDISPDYMRRWMSAAVKVFGSNRGALAKLNGSKLLSVLSLDDEILDGLQAGERFDGVGIDDVMKMTTREAKDWVRKQRQEIKELKEVHDRQLERKDERINDLEARLSRRELAARDEQANLLLNDLTQEVNGVIYQLDRAAATVEELLDGGRDRLTPDQDERWRADLVRARNALDRFVDTYGHDIEDPADFREAEEVSKQAFEQWERQRTDGDG